jgi:predicted DNA-binding transcriptional regulator AlpA
METSLEYFDSLPDAAHVRLPVVVALFACSPATAWRRVRNGSIPEPRKYSPRVTAWNVGDLRRALQGQDSSASRTTEPRKNHAI